VTFGCDLVAGSLDGMALFSKHMVFAVCRVNGFVSSLTVQCKKSAPRPSGEQFQIFRVYTATCDSTPISHCCEEESPFMICSLSIIITISKANKLYFFVF